MLSQEHLSGIVPDNLENPFTLQRQRPVDDPADRTDKTPQAGSSPARASFVLGIAMRQVNIVAIVCDQMSGTGAVPDNADTAAPLSALMRLLPDKVPVRILNLGISDLRNRVRTLSEEAGPDRRLLLDVRSSTDGLFDRLANALLKTDGMDDVLARHYSDAVGIAIATRALSQSGQRNSGLPKRSCGMLPKWRLKRVVEYVDTHLGEPITLAHLAAPTGLTRMHFAAQFRAATGIRPHEYLLRRRIEVSQRLLSQSTMPIVEIALSVGFQTQAHFTTVFKRFVGDTPYQWRRSHGGDSISPAEAVTPISHREMAGSYRGGVALC